MSYSLRLDFAALLAAFVLGGLVGYRLGHDDARQSVRPVVLRDTILPMRTLWLPCPTPDTSVRYVCGERANADTIPDAAPDTISPEVSP